MQHNRNGFGSGRIGNRRANQLPANRRTHGHSYQPPTQRHWSTYPGGSMQSGLGYTHTHGGTPPVGGGGRTQPGLAPSHSHPFYPETRAHMGPNAKGAGSMGYTHAHSQPRGGQPIPRRDRNRRKILSTINGFS